jgi:RND family efflux transporter MFP subunit
MKTRYNWKLIGGISVGALILLIVAVIVLNNRTDISTVDAKIDTLTRTIDVTGKIVPADEVTLGFAASGRISSLSVKEGQKVSRGQVLATIDSSEVEANLRQVVAERNVSQTEAGSLSGKLESQKRDAYNSIEKALNTSITQIKTNVDTLLNDPQTAKPKFKYTIRDFAFQQSLVEKRVEVGKMMEVWSVEVARINSENVSVRDLEDASENLNQVSDYLRDVARSLSEVEAGVSNTEAQLSEYKAIVTSARAAVDSVIVSVSTAQENLRSVDSEIPVQQARIVAASASIDKFQAQRNNYSIVAPFDGIVVDVTASAGESIAANQQVLVLMNNSSVEVEVFIPEIYMKDLEAGDPARVKIEALGDDFVVGAVVVYVEDRGIVRNGIVTYKTTLALSVDSPDIKSGMTAGIEIDTLVVENVLLIPRASTKISETVVGDVNQINATVEVLGENGKVVEKEIIIGRTDSSGFVEVVSGLSVGEKVVVSSI